jgi:acyl-homoserine-lactone acylase
MENHAELILQDIAVARGRSAEYFGPGTSNANVISDEQVVTYGIPKRAEDWLETGGTFQQQLIASFVAGANDYATQHADTISPVFQRVLPIQPTDVPALLQYTIHFTIMAAQSNVPQLVQEWSTGALAQRSSGDVTTKARKASNGWALAPSKSTTGNPILLGNPQLPWGVNQPIPGLNVFQFVEGNLIVGDPNCPVVNAYGATFPGMPFVGIGFNDYMGWTHTNNPIKNVDLYELQLANGGYLYDGAVKPFDTLQSQIKVLQPDGSYVTQTVTVLQSVQGPLIAQRGDRALALRVAGLNAPSMVGQYWQMMLSHDLCDFIRADSQLQAPFFNVVYADRKGKIMYVFGGRQPRRSGGTYADYTGILDGTTSSTLWTDTLSWSELPKTINPPGGFVQNSNDSPWFCTFPQTIQSGNYPAYIAGQDMFFRPQHGASFLLSKPQFTSDQVTAGKMSTEMIMADRILPDLIAAARASGDPIALASADVLSNWDRQSEQGSKGAFLFTQWWQRYTADPNSPKSTVWGASYPAFQTEFSPQDPLHTPVGLANGAAAVPFLITAANQIKAQYGALDVAWGDVNRVILVTHDSTFQQTIPLTNAPSNGSDEPFGSLRKTYYYPLQGTNQYFAYGAETYMQVVEFTPGGAKAKASITYGNASRPGSSHITDQLPYFEAKQLRPVYRSQADINQHAVKRESY